MASTYTTPKTINSEYKIKEIFLFKQKNYVFECFFVSFSPITLIKWVVNT